MNLLRTANVLAAFALTAVACAQFDGPAPLAWRWSQPAKVSPGGAPIVEGNTLYVAVGSRIYALDKATGNQLWRYPAGEPLAGSFRFGAVRAEGVIVAPADNNVIYGANAETGQGQWQFATTAPVASEPVVDGKRVIFQLSDNSLVVLDAATGSPVWDRPVRVTDGIMGSIGAFGGNVLVFQQNMRLTAYSIASPGKVSWQLRFSSLDPEVRPVILGDSLYVNTGQYLTCLHAGSGRKKWDRKTGLNLYRNPAASGDSVLACDRDGNCMAFTVSGAPISRQPIKLDSTPVADPSAIGALMAVPTANGSLNVIDPKSGSIVWNYIVRPATATVPGSGSAPAFVPLSRPAVLSGQTLYLLAADASLLAFDKDLGVDLTPPEVKMLWPAPGDMVSGQPGLEFVFKITDEASGVNSPTVKFEMDGKAMDAEFSRDGYLFANISASGKNRPLQDGRRTIKITATDWLGNTRVVQFALTIDNSLPVLGRPKGAEGQRGAGGGPSKSGGGGSLSGGDGD